MRPGFAAVGDWLQWCGDDRTAAMTGLREVAEVVARQVAHRYRMQAADREDLAADAYQLAVDDECLRLRRLRADTCVPAWLWGVARNLARSRSRKARRLVPWDADFEEPCAPESDDAAQASSPAPRLEEALAQLTPQQLEVERALLAGLSERATARLLGISRNAVRERAARGRARARRQLGRPAPDAAAASRRRDVEAPAQDPAVG